VEKTLKGYMRKISDNFGESSLSEHKHAFSPMHKTKHSFPDEKEPTAIFTVPSLTQQASLSFFPLLPSLSLALASFIRSRHV
jgi:hypothetical protein